MFTIGGGTGATPADPRRVHGFGAWAEQARNCRTWPAERDDDFEVVGLFVEGKAGRAAPQLPYRCGTMLLQTPADRRPAIFDAWQRAEEDYIALVDAHPRPRPEWVEIAGGASTTA